MNRLSVSNWSFSESAVNSTLYYRHWAQILRVLLLILNIFLIFTVKPLVVLTTCFIFSFHAGAHLPNPDNVQGIPRKIAHIQANRVGRHRFRQSCSHACGFHFSAFSGRRKFLAQGAALVGHHKTKSSIKLINSGLHLMGQNFVAESPRLLGATSRS